MKENRMKSSNPFYSRFHLAGHHHANGTDAEGKCLNFTTFIPNPNALTADHQNIVFSELTEKTVKSST